MFEHYTAAGGHAELVAYGRFGNGSHNMLGSGAALPIWVPRVDVFLASIGLPNTPVHPEYLPGVPLAPSHYAALEDVTALPYIGGQGVVYYQRFLEEPLPRAFAIGLGIATFYSGGFDPVLRR
jgi:hypothetical protein